MRQKSLFKPPLTVLSPRAQEGLDDLYMFGKDIWGLTLLQEQPHRGMANDLMQIYRGVDDKDFLLNCVPRDCFKTTFGSVCFSVWVQLNEIYRNNNYYYRVFFNASTKEKSWSLIQKIIDKFEYDEGIKQLYGPLAGRKVGVGQFSGYNLSPKYTTGTVSVVAEPNFFCGSQVSEQTGKHSDMNIHDDLSEEKNSYTPKAREKVRTSYRNSLSILRKDHGKQVMNCTSWHDDDVKGYIMRREQRLVEEEGESASRWVIRNFGAVLPDGSLYFPEQLSFERLEQLKHELGTYIYSCQYLNDPSSVGKLVQEDQIRFKDPKDFPAFKKFRITVDPAYGDDERSGGDFYWISVGGYDQFNTLYILDVRYGTDWTPAGLIDRLFQVTQEYSRGEDTPQILFEAEHGSVFRTLIGYEEARRGQNLRIHYFIRERSMDKWARWIRLQPRFENGRIFFSSSMTIAAQTEIKEQMLRAPNGVHDDFLDTLADMETGITMKVEDEGEVTDPSERRGIRMVRKMKTSIDPTTGRYIGSYVMVPDDAGPISFDELMKEDAVN